MKNLGFISAFIGGAIAGTALGILLAPAKGADTRNNIAASVDKFLKKHNISMSKKQVADLVENIKEAEPTV